MPITYQQSGVDPEKAARILKEFGSYLKTRPRDSALLSGIGPFASCYSLKDALKKYEDPILATCCDGVGTKALLAKEWDGLDGLGQDLVAMNVNDLICVGADPLLFLDYYACGKLEEKQLGTLLRSIQAGCELAGCTLAGGETAEMPGLYPEGDFDLGGFSVGMADRAKLLGPERVREGDEIVALASSGPHSNGYSLIRRLVEKCALQPGDRTPFGDSTWKQALLKPTVIYVSLLKGWNDRLHAAAHLTGGGLFENLPRVLPQGMRARVKAWEFPPLFQWLQREADLSTEQMLSTFNCGVGMLLIAPETAATELVRHAQQNGLSSWKAGRIEEIGNPASQPEIVWE